MVSIKIFYSAEHLSKNMFLENLLPMQLHGTQEQKSASGLIFPEKQTCISTTSGCLSFSKVSIDFLENL